MVPIGPGRRRPTRRCRGRTPGPRSSRCARPAAARSPAICSPSGAVRRAGAGHHPLLPGSGDIAGQLAASRCRGDGPPGPPRTACRAGRRSAAAWRSPPTAGVRAGSRPARRAPAGRRSGSGRSAARSWAARGRRTSRSRRVRPGRGRRARAAAGRTAGCWRVDRTWCAHARRRPRSSTQSPTRTCSTRPALGGQDDRDLGQRLLLALQSDPALPAQPGERGERGRIAGAGHLGGEVAPRRREPQQPVQAGPDHVGADQHQQPGAQVRQACRASARATGCRPSRSRQSGWSSAPLARHRCCQLSPGWVRSQFSTASTPSRRVCWLSGLSNANGAASTRAEHRGAARLGRRPRRGDRSGRERRGQLRPGRLRRHRSPAPRHRRRRGASTCAPPAVTTRPRRTGSAGSRPGIPPPAARPGRGRVGGRGRPARPAITSSVTGFR